jgi:hypothetical protein
MKRKATKKRTTNPWNDPAKRERILKGMRSAARKRRRATEQPARRKAA